jgi:hypothetical protein
LPNFNTTGLKSNKIVCINEPSFNDVDVNGNSIHEDDKNSHLDNFHLEIRGRGTRANRAGLGVARSLAVGKTTLNKPSEAENKFNWLFNDEETPRQDEKAHYDNVT